jgi:AraC-like DNA-binding protein
MGANQLRTRADAAERAQRAWTARVVGATWDQAADVAGFAHASSAVRAVRSYFDRLPQVDTDERRALWRERLGRVSHMRVQVMQAARTTAAR